MDSRPLEINLKEKAKFAHQFKLNKTSKSKIEIKHIH